MLLVLLAKLDALQRRLTLSQRTKQNRTAHPYQLNNVENLDHMNGHLVTSGWSPY
jgi:hypothetical protein